MLIFGILFWNSYNVVKKCIRYDLYRELNSIVNKLLVCLKTLSWLKLKLPSPITNYDNEYSEDACCVQGTFDAFSYLILREPLG